nr:hypothetical protein [Tanacetum cinerariifolium]
METWEGVGADKSTKLRSNDTDEMVNVLSSMEATNILTSGVVAVSVSPVVAATTAGVPTVSGLFPTASVIFTTASVVTPYTRRSREISSKDKGKEKVVESELARSHAGWKTKHFRGMTLEGIKEKFIPVWKQLEDFMPMSSKEEGKRVKRKGLKLDQRSAKRMKTSQDVSKEDLKGMMQLVPLKEVYVEALQVMHPIIDWEIHSEGQKEYWKIIRLGGHTTVYQFFVDMLKQFD